uniref:hypothetical protein n=1 Tax=Ruminococcus sp. TaxID=41978 RepID=UPI003AF54F5E
GNIGFDSLLVSDITKIDQTLDMWKANAHIFHDILHIYPQNYPRKKRTQTQASVLFFEVYEVYMEKKVYV